MAYGTPRTPRRDPAVLHRHPPRPSADRRAARRPHRRYDAIGGISPLAERTEAQRAALQAALDARRTGPLPRGARHEARRADRSRTPSTSWPPAASTRIVGLVLAPHYSAFSVGAVPRAAAASSRRAARHRRRRASRAGPPSRRSSSSSPPTCARRAGRDAREHHGAVHRALAAAADPRHRRPVSRPSCSATAAAVAERVGLDRGPWAIAWQSAGRTPGAVARARHPRGDRRAGRRAARRGVLGRAVGFVADHLEVLYDLDIEAAERAAAHGLRLRPHARASTTTPT